MRFSFPVELAKLERTVLGIILLAGLLHGLLYTFLAPPWQHYDEPVHFEYAWLIANRDGLPEADEYDQGMRREVAASMIENGFFTRIGYRPNLVSLKEPVWIGISQLKDPPVYYWLAALPLRLVRTSDITFQLYLGRLVSLSLYLLSIVAAYGIVAELSSPGSRLRWMIPATVVMIPGYTDMMSAVNNDVGAVAFFSLFLWAGVRLVRRGFSIIPFLVVTSLAALCVFTKNTVVVAVPLLLLALPLSIFWQRQRMWVWGACILIGLGMMLVMVTTGGVAAWYGQGLGSASVRVKSPKAPVGSSVLRLVAPKSGSPRARVTQLLSISETENLHRKVVTLGAWIWASERAQMHTLILDDGSELVFVDVEVDTTPAFYAFSTQVSGEARQIMIALESVSRDVDADLEIYYDGVVLVEGDFTQEGIPEFEDISGQRFRWGDRSVKNLVRNSSFENVWLRINPTLENALVGRLPFSSSHVLISLSDLSSSNWYYSFTAGNLVRTFWAKFGWGQVNLLGNKPYRVLGMATALGIVGWCLSVRRYRRWVDWDILVWMGITIVGIWAAALVRGISSLLWVDFIPSARYVYPVIVPTILLLSIGWREILRWTGRWVRVSPKAQVVVYFGFFLVLDVWALVSIVSYYAGG